MSVVGCRVSVGGWRVSVGGCRLSVGGWRRLTARSSVWRWALASELSVVFFLFVCLFVRIVLCDQRSQKTKDKKKRKTKRRNTRKRRTKQKKDDIGVGFIAVDVVLLLYARKIPETKTTFRKR